MTWNLQYSKICLKQPFFQDIKWQLRVQICQYKWSYHRFCCQLEPMKATSIADLTINTTYSMVIETLLESDLTMSSTSMYVTVAKSTSNITK